MFTVRVKDYFSSAHFLREYRGKCEKIHGHNWRVEVELFSDSLDKEGMVVDFSKLKKVLKKVLLELDHSFLNKLSYFRKKNPTSENIALLIFEKMSRRLSSCRHIKRMKVYVWEQENSCATFEQDLP